jgi:hypothetical protein
MLTKSWERGKGSGLISTPLTTLKIAVFAPMPSASVISAMAVNAGAIPNRRKTCFRTFIAIYYLTKLITLQNYLRMQKK